MTNINQEDEPLFSRVSMDRVSPEIAAVSRKNLSAILRACSGNGQVNAADRLEFHEATVSRMKLPGVIAGVTPQAVQKWVAQGYPSPDGCKQIEIGLKGQVTRAELHPELFGVLITSQEAAHV